MFFYSLCLIILIPKHFASVYLLALASSALFPLFLPLSSFSLEHYLWEFFEAWVEFSCPQRGSALASVSCLVPLSAWSFLDQLQWIRRTPHYRVPKVWQIPRGRFSIQRQWTSHSSQRLSQATFLAVPSMQQDLVLRNLYSKGVTLAGQVQLLLCLPPPFLCMTTKKKRFGAKSLADTLRVKTVPV